jgi:hypothetical protein
MSVLLEIGIAGETGRYGGTRVMRVRGGIEDGRGI